MDRMANQLFAKVRHALELAGLDILLLFTESSKRISIGNTIIRDPSTNIEKTIRVWVQLVQCKYNRKVTDLGARFIQS